MNEALLTWHYQVGAIAAFTDTGNNPATPVGQLLRGCWGVSAHLIRFLLRDSPRCYLVLLWLESHLALASRRTPFQHFLWLKWTSLTSYHP